MEIDACGKMIRVNTKNGWMLNGCGLNIQVSILTYKVYWHILVIRWEWIKFNCKTNIRKRNRKEKTKKILGRRNKRGEMFKEQKVIYCMKWFIDVMETRMIWKGRKVWRGRMNSVGIN